MRKLLLWVLALILVIPLSACADVTVTATPTPDVSPSPGISPNAAASIFPTASPSAMLTEFVPDTDIPDDLGLPNDRMVANSNNFLDCCLCEDDANLYYADDSDLYSADDNDETEHQLTLYCISKQDGTIKVISQNCGSFTLCEGKIYYITPSSSDFHCNVLKCCDPVTGTEKTILKLKNGIFDIVGYNGKLYFTYETVIREGYDLPITDLYSINPDGRGKKMIQENVFPFCVYEDTIYYHEASWLEDAPLFQCRLDGSGSRLVYDETSSPGVSGNGIFYSNGEQDFVMDIDTGNITRLPDNTDETWQASEYHQCTLLGKYVLCLAVDELKSPRIIAFDTASGRTYKLLQLKNYDYSLYTTPYGNYVVWKDDNGKIHIGRIIISGGKASIEECAVI